VTRVAVVRDPTRGPGIGQFAVIQAMAPPRSVACIIAMSVEPREIGKATHYSPPNCPQFIFEQGQALCGGRRRLARQLGGKVARESGNTGTIVCLTLPSREASYDLRA